MTREEPSHETLWLQKIRTMDKVQIIDRSNIGHVFIDSFESFKLNNMGLRHLNNTGITIFTSSHFN
jgi:hypothetical protein